MIDRKLARHLAAALAVAAAPAARAVGPEEVPAPVKLVKSEVPGGGALVAGSLAAARHATISTRISATVRQVLVEEGTRVAAGQLLVRLSDDDVQGQLAAAQTALQTAAAYERRISDLVGARAATPVELEQAQAQRAQAEAAVAAAKATLAYSQLRAPFAGTVQARRVTAGDLVGPGQPLLELEGGELELQASLSEEESKGLELGQRLRFAARDAEGEAQITALTPGGDALSHRRFLRARVLRSDKELRSGTFARVAIPAASPTATAWLPRTALVERGDLTGVFVAQDGRAYLRWIALGEPLGDRVPVRSGLEVGEQVIDAPGALRDGQRVEVGNGR